MKKINDKKATIEFQDVTKIYGEGATAVTAVNGASLTVSQEEIILIMGPSGSGKTTLLSMGGGILRPTAGVVKVAGQDITQMSEKELVNIRRDRVGFIFQSFNLLDALTALENVMIAAELAGIQSGKSEKLAQKLLSGLGLHNRMQAIPADLSGGEKQRVAIARALINDPDLVLADEPTANLDSKIGHEVMSLLKAVAKERKKSVLIVSHDNRIRDIADRILWLEDGQFKELRKMVVDPVCGMSIERGEHHLRRGGKEHFFCSQGCMREFKLGQKK
jgi:putative ABC transport system ATP-binding protein